MLALTATYAYVRAGVVGVGHVLHERALPGHGPPVGHIVGEAGSHTGELNGVGQMDIAHDQPRNLKGSKRRRWVTRQPLPPLVSLPANLSYDLALTTGVATHLGLYPSSISIIPQCNIPNYYD